MARADFLQCQYPNNCFFFDVVPGIGRIVGYIQRGPTEQESQHWQQEYGSGSLTINIGANFAVPELQSANGGLTVGVSVTLMWAGWVCADERYECPEPTIIQTWNKDHPPRTKSKATAVRPIAALLGAPWPPVDDVNVKRGWMLPAQPEDQSAPAPGVIPGLPQAPAPEAGVLPPVQFPGQGG